MNKLKISTRLGVLIGILSVIMIVIGTLGISGMASSNASLKSVYQNRTVALGRLLEVQQLILLNRVYMNHAVAMGDAEVTKSDVASVLGSLPDLKKSWDALAAGDLTPKEKELLDSVAASRKLYSDGYGTPTVTALKGGDYELAKQLSQDKERVLYAPVREGLKALAELEQNVALQEYDAAQGSFNSMRAISIGSLVLGLIFAAVWGWSLLRGISRSLGQATAMSNAVAQGDLTRSYGVEGSDEVAGVLRSLEGMQHSLRNLSMTLRHRKTLI